MKKHTIEISDAIVIIRFSSIPGIEDILHAMNEVSDNYDSTHRLWDLSLCGLDLSTEELLRLSNHGKQIFSSNSKVAIVAKEDLTFGISRMYEAYRSEDGLKMNIFRTEKEAIEWLKNTKKM